MRRLSKVFVTTVVVAAVAAGTYYAIVKVREKKALAEETAGHIKDELDALDPVTRAAVVAKLSSDAVRNARDRG